VTVDGRLLTVLTYHRVDEPGARAELDPGLVSATPRAFERQVAWLAAATTPLALDDLLAVRRGEARLPHRAVLVTFDDAYCGFAEHAWPVLRRHGVPVTLFVPTAYPGAAEGFWWDRLHHALTATARRKPLDTPAGTLALAGEDDRRRAHRALVAWLHRAPHDEAMAVVDEVCAMLAREREPPAVAPSVLGWNALRRLSAEGVALAPHTRTHARLDRVGARRVRAELAGARDDLVAHVGRSPPAFAYPAGGHDEESRAALEREGFELAFTTRRGANDLGRADWLALRRVNVGRRSSLPVLRAQLRRWPGRALTAVARAEP
jgi:peptidoglycan/xylan/chitin deacetylase (PgdA/CDA1 family)